jgi:hypothetical protein
MTTANARPLQRNGMRAAGNLQPSYTTIWDVTSMGIISVQRRLPSLCYRRLVDEPFARDVVQGVRIKVSRKVITSSNGNAASALNIRLKSALVADRSRVRPQARGARPLAHLSNNSASTAANQAIANPSSARPRRRTPGSRRPCARVRCFPSPGHYEATWDERRTPGQRTNLRSPRSGSEQPASRPRKDARFARGQRDPDGADRARWATADNLSLVFFDLRGRGGAGR